MESVLSVTLASGSSTSYNNNYYVDSIKVYIDTAQYTTGIKQLAVTSQQIAVYPNPTKDVLNVVYSGTNSNAEITVINIIGEVAMQYVPLKNQHATIDVSNLSGGVYFVQLKTPQGMMVQKFIKQ
jgi:hypothetical protein